MLKGYYVFGDLYDDDGTLRVPGVKKKIEAQIEQFKKLGEIREVVIKRKPSTTYNKIAKRIPIGSHMNDWDKAFGEIKEPDYLYLRKEIIDQGMIRFLKQIKTSYPNTKILMELPTYPYDQEQFFSEVKTIPLYINDAIYRKALKKYIDRIVTFSSDERIFRVPTIKTQNGVDIKKCPIREPRKTDGNIHLIAVASFQKFHGYERVIQGLADYYINGGERKIIFDLVGDGIEKQVYIEEVNKYQIQNHVVFWGSKQGKELDEIFNMADIGLGSFGFYKIGLDMASSLKIREYIARGLPIAGGSKLELFSEETFPFYLEYSNDERPVDIQKLLDFHDTTYYTGKSTEEVIHFIRKFAENNVSWDRAFYPVIDFLAQE